ncbi:MAG TPA: thioredoxin domain-containing protein [Nannocystaceae bacterium]|nr:thioredoxin domain-containing protein [Nannocystaceae bacterium]
MKRAAVALALALSFVPSCKDDEPETPGIRIDAERYRVELRDDDYAKGSDAPLVTVVLFTDYACPPCGKTWTVMQRLAEDYGDDLRIVYRAYTAAGFARGEQAIEAAFAAGAQDKFWEMHARLFEHAGELDRPMLRAHAEALGLDVPRFLDELDTGAHTGRRIRDLRQATALGITGLPVAFVNGLYVAGYADEKTWHGILKEEMKRARAVVDDGVPRAELYASLMAKAATKRVGKPEGTDELRKELVDRTAVPPPQETIRPKADARYRIEPSDIGVRGPVDAPVVIVAFVDFQCPFCQRAWKEELEPLLEEHAQDVALAIRQFPLEIHPAAPGAAKAVLAAAKQGKAWEFHDRLYAHEGALGRSHFQAWVKELGMDEAKFLADLDAPATAAEVEADVRIAHAVGVAGTPGFFVNGRYLDGYKKGSLRGLVDEELARAAAMTKAGTPRAQVFAKTMAEAVPESEFPNR